MNECCLGHLGVFLDRVILLGWHSSDFVGTEANLGSTSHSRQPSTARARASSTSGRYLVVRSQDLSKLDHIIQQAKEVQARMFYTCRQPHSWCWGVGCWVLVLLLHSHACWVPALGCRSDSVSVCCSRSLVNRTSCLPASVWSGPNPNTEQGSIGSMSSQGFWFGG